jgi:hypothetical protein
LIYSGTLPDHERREFAAQVAIAFMQFLGNEEDESEEEQE